MTPRERQSHFFLYLFGLTTMTWALLAGFVFVALSVVR